MDDTTRKAAVLVSALDPQSADLLLERMSPEQARRVRDAIMELEDVSAEEEEATVNAFLHVGPPPRLPDEGVELSLSGRFHESPPETEVASEQEVQPFQFLEETPPTVLADHLRGESPQVIAVVVAHLAPARAARLIAQFDSRLQVDVLRRVAELDLTDRSVLLDVEQQLEHLLADEIRAARNRASGSAAVAAILRAAGSEQAELAGNMEKHDHSLLELLQEHVQRASAESKRGSPRVLARRPTPKQSPVPAAPPPEATAGTVVAQPVRSVDTGEPPPAEHISTSPPPDFQLLAGLSDADLGKLFSRLPAELILLALVGAEPDFVKRLLRPLPRRESQQLKKKMASIGPLKLKDIEQAQRQVMTIAEGLVRGGVIAPFPDRRFAAAA